MRPEVLFSLFASVTTLPGIGPRLEPVVERLAGPHVVDLVWHLPVGLIDRSLRPKLADAPEGTIVTLEVQVDEHIPSEIRSRPYRVQVSDDTGFMTLTFFHARTDYLKRVLPVGEKRLISGKVESFRGERQMLHPDHIVDPAHADELPLKEPIYGLTEGLAAKTLRKAIEGAMERLPDLPEWLDPAWKAKQGWHDWAASLRMAHEPESLSDLEPRTIARARLAYDELLANQLALLLIRDRETRAAGRILKGTDDLIKPLLRALPYKLTGAQTRTLKEIRDDMASGNRMVRLLQGDVGSGKTVVALISMLTAVETGAQAAMMAPTELLCRQHFEALDPLCREIGIEIRLLTSATPSAERQETLARLAGGQCHLIVGTHALFQQDVVFHDLALAVIDEQHRFGVQQRLSLSGKGRAAHTLVMTATPIPRTLTLTAYGDMDVSKLDEKPPGRQEPVTRAIPVERLGDVVEAVRRALQAGEQVFWVCPLVEESELVDATAAEDRYAHLRELFGTQAALAHGQMKAAERDAVMTDFRAGRSKILVATTVIEVGVDVPQANIMVIEQAERFGLAQLHQLRGRVGRGQDKATCLLLFKHPLGETARARLDILRKTNDGFLIAEEDLRLRGAGDLLGTKQSGMPGMKLADLSVHADLLAAAHDDARLIMANDPELESERGKALRVLLYLFERDEGVRLLRAG